MAKTRKDEPILLSDNQLYALMLAIYEYRKNNPNDNFINQALAKADDIIQVEHWARFKEQQRIDDELEQLAKEYE
jgi:hypothetical protein